MKTKGKGAMAFIFAVVFLDLLGVNLIVSMQAFLVRQYDTDALTVSLLTVIYSAAQFVAAPVLGMVSDHIGPQPLIGPARSSCSWLVMVIRVNGMMKAGVSESAA